MGPLDETLMEEDYIEYEKARTEARKNGTPLQKKDYFKDPEELQEDIDKAKLKKEDDNNSISVLYFEYKTYMSQVHKIKNTSTGGKKALKKDDKFNPPKNEDYEKVERVIEVVYEGVKIVGSGSEKVLKW